MHAHGGVQCIMQLIAAELKCAIMHAHGCAQCVMPLVTAELEGAISHLLSQTQLHKQNSPIPNFELSRSMVFNVGSKNVNLRKEITLN